MLSLDIQNRCDETKIHRRFRPLIGAAIDVYAKVLPRPVVDIRLLGSVARGDAVVGRSDIDFVALIEGVPDAVATQRLEDEPDGLPRAFPVVTSVELDVEPVCDLPPSADSCSPATPSASPARII